MVSYTVYFDAKIWQEESGNSFWQTPGNVSRVEVSATAVIGWDAGDVGKKRRHSLEPNKYPYISPSLVNLARNESVTDTARYPLVKVHGELLISLCVVSNEQYGLLWLCDDHQSDELSRNFLLVLRCRLSTLGPQAFAVAGPLLRGRDYCREHALSSFFLFVGQMHVTLFDYMILLYDIFY